MQTPTVFQGFDHRHGAFAAGDGEDAARTFAPLGHPFLCAFVFQRHIDEGHVGLLQQGHGQATGVQADEMRGQHNQWGRVLKVVEMAFELKPLCHPLFGGMPQPGPVEKGLGKVHEMLLPQGTLLLGLQFWETQSNVGGHHPTASCRGAKQDLPQQPTQSTQPRQRQQSQQAHEADQGVHANTSLRGCLKRA